MCTRQDLNLDAIATVLQTAERNQIAHRVLGTGAREQPITSRTQLATVHYSLDLSGYPTSCLLGVTDGTRTRILWSHNPAL